MQMACRRGALSGRRGRSREARGGGPAGAKRGGPRTGFGAAWGAGGSAVDGYLYLVGRMGLEQMLCEGCLSGRTPTMFAGCASIEPNLVFRTVEDDGGTAEGYEGNLTVAGVRYSFACELFADADGAYF